jgi:queuine tRNA-ribosyltransferase
MSVNAATFRLLTEPAPAGPRAGELVTPHGVVPTPVLLPVGSQGTVKTLTQDEVRAAGMGMLLANTYHLYLRPGIPVIEQMGGLHRFMGWDGAILTDSGGYQVFSLAGLRRVSDEGVVFRSHIDGSRHTFTPELAVRYQESLGSDIAMVLDECIGPGADQGAAARALVRTNRWAERCRDAHSRPDQALYAIVQGGMFPDLRRESVEYLVGLDFLGYAIGGLSIGEPKQMTLDLTAATAVLLPVEKPRYLMGVGSPEDLVEGVARGIDIFDSALPTRVARNGALFTPQGRVNILNAAFSRREAPLMDGCGCYTCRTFSAAYVHHLFKARELLAYRLATVHNLAFVSDLVGRMRRSILAGTFGEFRTDFLGTYRATDEPTRLEQKRKWLAARGRKE